MTRKELISYCKTFPGAYEDYPFRDTNWTVMRCQTNRKGFAFLYEKDGLIWVNLKCSPEWTEFFRSAFPSVVPAYHMNKKHWNSIIMDGTVPEKEIRRMIAESYDLVLGAKEKENGKGKKGRGREKESHGGDEGAGKESV